MNQSYFFKFGMVGSYYPKANFQHYITYAGTTYSLFNEKLERTAFGVFVSGGLNIKKLFVEARYEPSALNLIANDAYAIFKTTCVSILLGYKLK